MRNSDMVQSKYGAKHKEVYSKADSEYFCNGLECLDTAAKSIGDRAAHGCPVCALTLRNESM